MHRIGKSYKWLFSIALLASLISNSGYTDNPAMHQNITTELVGLNNPETASYPFYINAKNTLQTKHLALFLRFDFNHFLNTYNKICNVKFWAQNRATLSTKNYYSLNESKLISPVNTDDYNNIFIG